MLPARATPENRYLKPVRARPDYDTAKAWMGQRGGFRGDQWERRESRGASRFDGINWESSTTEDGLLNNDVSAREVSPPFSADLKSPDFEINESSFHRIE